MKKPKTKAQADRATDQRLQKTYNITLEDYNQLAKLKKNGCWICGRVPDKSRLHVDHDHSWKKVKIEADKNCSCDNWHVWATYNGSKYSTISEKKSLGVRNVKRQLLRASVRGLLCYTHNTAIARFRDNIVDLRAAAWYLETFYRNSPLPGQETK